MQRTGQKREFIGLALYFRARYVGGASCCINDLVGVRVNASVHAACVFVKAGAANTAVLSRRRAIEIKRPFVLERARPSARSEETKMHRFWTETV